MLFSGFSIIISISTIKMQNNSKQEFWVIGLLAGVAAITGYGAYYYSHEMKQIDKIKNDICGTKPGLLSYFGWGAHNRLKPSNGQQAPISVE